jgi:hypothetical protein
LKRVVGLILPLADAETPEVNPVVQHDKVVITDF